MPSSDWTQVALARIVLLCLAWFSLCALGACIAPQPQHGQAKQHRASPVALTEPQRSAKSVFVAMQQRYTLAHSLDDRGTVKISMRALEGATWETQVELGFHAAFERTTKRFSLDIGGPMVGMDDRQRTVTQTRMQIWGSAPGVVHVWSSEQPAIRELAFEDAIARTAYADVGQMLVLAFAQILGRRNLELVAEEPVAGESCYVLRQQFEHALNFYWIAKADHSLRRLSARVEYRETEADRRQYAARAPSEAARKSRAEGPLRMMLQQQTTEFAPRFDTKIADARFELAPPELQAPRDVCLGRAVVADGSEPLIEDFEDTTGHLANADHRDGRWWVFGDEGCVRTPVDPHVDPPEGANPSRSALHVAAYDCRTWGFGLGFALNGAAGRCAYDAGVYDGISFWAGSGGLNVTARLTVGTRQTQPFAYGGDGSCEAAGNRGCWDQYSAPIALTPDWRQYAVSWAELRFPSSGNTVPFDVKQLTSIALSTTAEPTIVREIWLDQVSFFKGKPAPSPF